jgi:putative oxidoreductase
MMRTFLKSLPSAMLVLLFVYAATSKLMSIGEFRIQLHRQPFPPGVSDALLYLLPASEIVAAILLLFMRTSFAGLQLSLALLILFTGYVTLVLLHFWSKVPCACGGILNHMTWRTHLVFNCCFIAINIIAIKIHLKERRPVT